MKILHMILTLGGGGAEKQLTYIAGELGRRGHDVHVAFTRTGVHSGRLDAGMVTLHQLTASTRYDPRGFIQLLSLLRRVRPDAVQTWLTHMDIVGGAAAKIFGIPWVMSERSAALSYPPVLLNRLRIAAGRRADLIVSNSPGGADYWTGQGVSASRIEVVPNFVPMAEIDSADPVIDSRIASDDELVIHVGRLSPEKNLGLLVEALPSVFQIRPKTMFAFCGEGPMLADLKARVAAAGMDGRVIFLGFVESVASWLKRSRAAVTISMCEGHPNAVLEAMAAGVPVVVSDIPAYRSILADNEAFFVESHDVKAIAGAIVKALENRPDAEGRAARARSALALQSIGATAMRYELAYQRAIDFAASRARRPG
ncbi:MAG: glycosyltransferase [Thermoanaerobaculia bacterium]